MSRKTFGEKLKSLREKAELSQQELARRADVPQTSISFFERGERLPTWGTVCALADVLGVKLDELR